MKNPDIINQAKDRAFFGTQCADPFRAIHYIEINPWLAFRQDHKRGIMIHVLPNKQNDGFKAVETKSLSDICEWHPARAIAADGSANLKNMGIWKACQGRSWYL